MSTLEPVDLPDGWHQLPGDGKTRDARKRVSVAYGAPDEFTYFVWVKGGQVVVLLGTSIETIDAHYQNGPDEYHLAEAPRFLAEALARWGIHPQDVARQLVPEPDTQPWVDDLILED